MDVPVLDRAVSEEGPLCSILIYESRVPKGGGTALTVLSLLAVSKTLLSASSAAKSPTMFSSVTATTSSVRFLWGTEKHSA